MSKSEERGALVNAHFNTRLLFLAKLAARHKDQTLIEFIEDALKLALSPAAMQEDEPNVTEPTEPIQPSPLWMEGLWVDTGDQHRDETTRLFLVGMADVSLLAPKQWTLFHHVLRELAQQRKKVTLKNFVEFFDYSESGE